MHLLSTLTPASERIPIEILLAIIQRSPPSCLAAFTQCSFACLELASPLLYNYVVLKDFYSASMFFAAPPSSPRPAPHLLPFTSRTQTKHLHIEIPHPEPNEAPPARKTLHHPSSGRLLLDSYSNAYNEGSFRAHINPSLVIIHSEFKTPTLLGHVQWTSLHSLLFPSTWDRAKDVVLFGSFPHENTWPNLSLWARDERDIRVTMDLSMIESSKADPRNPNGSYQRLVKTFVGRLKERVRGRIGVGSEEMRRMFEIAREEMMVRSRGKPLEAELRRLSVEILEVTRHLYRTT